MFKASKALGFSVLFVWVAAILHMETPLVAGFSKETFWLVPAALVVAVLGYLTIPNRRWLAWLLFFVLLAGCITAIAIPAAPGVIPDWWWLLILAADGLATLLLFVYLWKPKPVLR